MIPKFFKNPYDFQANWKHITSKDSIFQVIVLLSNLAFFHDLTCILGIQNKAQPNQPNQPNFLDQLTLFSAYLEQQLKQFCESIRGKNTQSYPKNPFYLQCQYVLLLRYHCDVLKRFIECRVSSIEEFEYLALPKFSFEFSSKSVGTGDIFDNTLKNYKKTLEDTNVNAAYNQLTGQSEIIKVVDTLPSLENFDVGLRFMNYHLQYGYELLPSSPAYIYTTFSQRCILTLAGALATNIGALVRGPNNVGKRSTVKAFSQLIGKELFTFDCYGVNFDFIVQIFQGMAAGGFWVMFENIQNLDFGLLSSFCNIVRK